MSDHGKLSGKTALVTGASSGLGRHFAKVLAREGAAVTVAARRLDKLEELATSIHEAGGAARAVTLDVTDPTSIHAAVERPAFDTVVNNAGLTHDGPALETSAQTGTA